MSDAPLIAYFAKAASLLGTAAQLPDDIQWMPPGTHDITASRGDEVVQLRITVTEATARVMAGVLQGYRDKGDKPYIDFNHNDDGAAGHIAAFSWGGDDPATGGVRAKIEWSEPGKQSVLGRAYRRFSPSFFSNANGEVTGAPIDMGGLVNRPAFKTIQPIWSRDQSANQQKQMNEEQLRKLQADLAAALAENAAFKAKIAELESNQTVKAREAEITGLKAKIETLETQAKAHRKERATAKVEAAVKAGRIPPQNTEIQAKWVGLLESDDSHAALLDALPVQAGLGTVINPSGQQQGQQGQQGQATAEGYAALVKAKHTGSVTKLQAIDLAMQENPAAYKAWRDANGKPGI